MKNAKRKKKRSRAVNPSCKPKDDPGKGKLKATEEAEKEKKRKVLEALVQAFSLSSLDEAASAYRDADGDPDKAAEILRRAVMIQSAGFCPSTCSTSSGASALDFASTSGSSEGFMESNFKGGKQKKLFAATGTVSTVLGKEYVRRNPTRPKRFSNGVLDKEDAEQFLCSMLGEDSDLSLAVVRDVLCQCGYDIDKALDVLLDLCASSYEQSGNDRHSDNIADDINDMRFLVGQTDNMLDRRSECTSLSSEGEFPENFWSLGSVGRNYAKVLSSSEAPSSISPGNIKSDLPQKVLESLFNIPKSTEHDIDTMNWRNVAKKVQSLGHEFEFCPRFADTQQHDNAKGDDYHMFRENAKQHWESMKSCYEKAASAFAKGDRAYAAYLSDQGREQTKLAQKADVKASHDIFLARNKGIENVITIDLHGQHVKPAMRMLKLHLLFGSYVPSVQTLRVITGCGSHGVGKSKLKQSVIKLLEQEAIEWSEENRGTLLIKFSGYRHFGFLDSDSNSDSN